MARAAVLAMLALLAPVAPPVRAAPSSCPWHFAFGQAPDRLKAKLADRAVDLCFDGYAVEHSGLTRTPLWSAEHLTAAAVEAARALPRQGRFHAEPRLPDGQSAQLSDYIRSGYDRGHMSPNGDMPTAEAQQQSFSLANMVPQAPQLNRGLWEGIESAVRTWAIRSGEVYVVTGPVYQGDRLQALQGRVLVPTSVYKAVYDPAGNRAGVYLSHNTDDSDYETISVTELQALTGIDVFPGIPARVKMEAARLPTPIMRSTHHRRERPSLIDRLISALLGGRAP